jgi:hypothetical protein
MFINLNGVYQINGDASKTDYIYDISGRMIKRVAVNASFPDIWKAFGRARGVYIIKIGE